MGGKLVFDSFWTDPEIRSLTKSARYLFLYFITAPTSHFSGIYYIPISTISSEAGFPIDELQENIAILYEKNLVKFDYEFSVTWVIKMLFHQITSVKTSAKPDSQRISEHQIISVNRHLLTLHKCPLIRDFFEIYKVFGITYPIDTLPIPSQDPIDTPRRFLFPISGSIFPISKSSLQEISEGAFKLSQLLLQRIRERHPGFKPRFSDNDFKRWAIEIEKMLRLDKRELQNIEKVILWCQMDGNFWQNNILSTGKLREKFDRLWMEMNKKTRKKEDGINKAVQKIKESMHERTPKAIEHKP
jgi:hypothetical protein